MSRALGRPEISRYSLFVNAKIPAGPPPPKPTAVEVPTTASPCLPAGGVSSQRWSPVQSPPGEPLSPAPISASAMSTSPQALIVWSEANLVFRAKQPQRRRQAFPDQHTVIVKAPVPSVIPTRPSRSRPPFASGGPSSASGTRNFAKAHREASAPRNAPGGRRQSSSRSAR